MVTVMHSKDQHKAKKCLPNTPRKIREQMKNEIIAKEIIQYFHQTKATHEFFYYEKSLSALIAKKKNKNNKETNQVFWKIISLFL